MPAPTTSSSHPPYQPKSAWSITLLLTALSTINFLDKIVFGMVTVPLMADMQLSPAQFGFVAGSFFWLFSISMILIGFLSNRIETRWILLAMGASWSVLQLPQAYTTSLFALRVCRVILGAAEGPAFPTSVHALVKWFPDQKRNLPVAVTNQRAALGELRGRFNVNAVAFGLIHTRMTSAEAKAGATVRIDGRDIRVGLNPEMLKTHAQRNPPGRGGTPEEAAGGVYLFCSPESNYITEQTIAVAGNLQ